MISINLSSLKKVVFDGKEVQVLNLNDEEIFPGFKKLEQLIVRDVVNVDSKDLEGINKIGSYAFAKCLKLSSIVIPNTVTEISNMAFYYCENLTNLSLSNNLISIGASAFEYCKSLQTITIPNNVTSIGMLAFANCNNLSTIRLLPTTPPTLEADAISTTVNSIEVPASSLSDYQNAENWNAFADKMVGV